MKPLFAAGVETLITLLVFFLITAASTWLKKKQQGEEGSEAGSGKSPATPPQPPRRVAPGQPQTAPPKQLSWEDELRRLLGGESEELPSQPPPVIVQPAPQSRPAPAPPPLPRGRPSVMRPRPAEHDRGRQVPGLAHSAEASLQAIQLEKNVQQELRRVEARAVARQVVKPVHQIQPELAQARGLLRGQQSLRAAFAASVVLGPPKANEG